jgi:hypothetical protein
MPWGEAIRLVGLISQDPSSQLCAQLNGWKAPRSAEWLVLADLFDVFIQANSTRRQPPYPRPFPDANAKRTGKTDLPRAQVIELLNRHGHNFDPEGSDDG